MNTRQIPQRDALALKQASGELVKLAGGVSAAAQLTQASQSRVSEAISEWHDNRWLSLVQVADLEAATGQPVLARALALLAGFDLAPRQAPRAQSMHQHLIDVISSTGTLESEIARAMADGEVSEPERLALRRDVRLALDRLQALDADLTRAAPTPSLAAVR